MRRPTHAMTALIALAALAALACAGVSPRGPLAPGALDAAAIQGTWHVIASTLPLWTEGEKRSPSFTYSALRVEDGRVRFDDRVTYVEDGEVEHIDGVDAQHEVVSTRFRWRGRGWLFPFTSDWDVVALDEEGRWAAITFESTLFTPRGLDVISRSEVMAPEALAAIVAKLRSDPALADLLPELRALER